MSKLTRPDDFWIGGVWQTERRRGDLPAYLKPGEHASTKKSLRDFGIMQMRKTGEYEVQFSLQTPQGQIVCPPWKFTVVDTPPRDVLDSHRVLLTGLEARAPANEQEWIAVEQVTLGNRIWLIYRKYYSAKNGGGIAYTFRIRELAAKVELKVEGVYGDRTPIKIQYKDAASPSGTTTLLLDSVDGRPWEDEAERLRLKHLAPAPRLKP